MNSYIYFDKQNKLHVTIYEDEAGQICPYFLPQDPIFKQGAAYASIYGDLKDCIEAIEYLKGIMGRNIVPKMVETSILFSSVVKYARCFNKAEGRGTSLNSKAVFKEGREGFQKFHREVMNLRNKYIAHAGDSGLDNGAIMLVLNPSIENRGIEKMVLARMSLQDDDPRINDYLTLFKEVQSHVESKLNVLKSKMEEKYKIYDLEEIYSYATYPSIEELTPSKVNKLNH